MKNFRYAGVAALAMMAFAGPASATTITLVSDATTLGAATEIGVAQTGDTTGLTFVPVSVGGFGTFTGVPAGAPAGAVVINIAPGDGESGFFKSVFTLPSVFTNISITGAASIDDATSVYLNGNYITGANHDITFTSAEPSYFKAGLNELVFSDLNSGGGPSGGGFYATITYDEGAVPEPATWAMMLAGFGAIGGAMRRRTGQTAAARA